jgi:ubiquinone/menaquinone biosynthesis C-methylase UbiE
VVVNYKKIDAASYDIVAEEFDSLTEWLSAPIALQMIKLAHLKPSDSILDVGTGTGLLALQAARLVSGGQVVGVDHSRGMIEQARNKARRSGFHEAVIFCQSDAEHLEFSDESFHVVFSLYALFHFPDPLKALSEMYRVLRPGGHAVIGVGSGPVPVSRSGILQSMQRITDLFGIASGRLLIAPQFLRDLMAEHGMNLNRIKGPRTSSRIERMLRQVGFTHIRRYWQGHRENLNPEDFWRVQVTFASHERIRLQEASAHEVADLKQKFLERCRRVQANNGRLIYPHGAMLYAGIRG